ncbi:MAG: hypothetical protein Q4E75_04045 [bacterium]|nr:hypothetical protein [bacterium]
MENKNFKTLIILAIILVLIGISYFILNKIIDKPQDNLEYLKDYDVNEYIATYISDEKMAKIYFNEFIYYINNNLQLSYEKLNDEYKNIKFPTYDSYLVYINNLNISNNMKKYYKKEIDGYIIFGVYDYNDNFYAFKTKGVKQYSVYLDDSTVEIW